jgi:hypothetical protein
MPVIRLPDGSERVVAAPVTVAEVAASIGAGLARVALAGKVNGQLVDTSHRIDSDASLAIVTDKDADGVDLIRHSCAHLLAFAVKQLFPDAQVTIGPVIEDGFYYDFSYKRPFTQEDLAAIEKRMGRMGSRRRGGILQIHRRALQGRVDCRHSPGADHFPVPRGRFRRPLPRPPCAFHRQDQGIQADEAGRRLLAR